MPGLDLAPTVEAWVAIGIILGMLVLFIRETFPVEATAIAGAALLLVLGILPQDRAMEVLSNSAPWTIAAMFIVVGALVRTGALDWVTQLATRHVATRPRTTVSVLGVGIVGAGAGELIAEAVIAVETAAVARDLADSIHAHPTLSETLMEAAEAIVGQATHTFRPKK